MQHCQINGLGRNASEQQEELPLGLTANPGGIKVLGSPVGSDDFCTDHVRAALGEAASPLPLISQLNPQQRAPYGLTQHLTADLVHASDDPGFYTECARMEGVDHGGTHPTEAAEPANGLPPEPGDTAPLPRVGPTAT
ncbi:unnamed protein product [Closterium sp. NIES-65]|nr:unnamed protein product [Closterium sp. NIES-65]